MKKIQNPAMTPREQEEHDLAIAKAYGKLRDHIEEIARKRTKRIFPERADAFAMFALIQTAWDLAVKLQCESQFMNAIGKLTGADVRQVQPTEGSEANAPVIPGSKPRAAEAGDGSDEASEGTTRH